MKKNLNRNRFLAMALLLGALATPGCSQLDTREKLGVVLVTAGVAGPLIEQGEKAEAAAAVAGSLVAAGIAEAYIIERKKATAEQIRTAEANARKAYAKMSEEDRQSLKEDDIRYISVKTVRTGDSRGQEDVMLYDTVKKKVSPGTAYDLRVAPEKGERVKFDRVITEYVGDDND